MEEEQPSFLTRGTPFDRTGSVSCSFSDLLRMIPKLVPGPSESVLVPGIKPVCRGFLQSRCFKTDCNLEHPTHVSLVAAIQEAYVNGTMSQVPVAPPSAASMVAARVIRAAEAHQAYAAQQAQSQSSKDSTGVSEKDEDEAEMLKRTVQVSNLVPNVTAEHLKLLFGLQGVVVECTVTDSQHSAYIEYSKPEQATAALALNNMKLGGRPLNVEMAKSLPPKPATSE
ncbi:uncharacterized protein LOC141592606 [Silene latifolia]|uniref:uncharacterized protein LOC141592606 n=1 Tax=Silene latifolia TaxID=37657 RepID=UPI003D77D4EA